MLAIVLMRVLPSAMSAPSAATPAPQPRSFVVSGQAMQPNFHPGQVVTIEDVAAAKLSAGEVVLVDMQGHSFLKRVIGLPGDVVSIHDGRVYVNDRLLAEPYIAEQTTSCRPDEPCGQGRPYAVGRDSVFVLGDNRSNSSDSREFGALPFAQIAGRVR
jgi:signal peptidase I